MEKSGGVTDEWFDSLGVLTILFGDFLIVKRLESFVFEGDVALLDILFESLKEGVADELTDSDAASFVLVAICRSDTTFGGTDLVSASLAL